MRKLLPCLTLLFFPFFTFAQNDAPVYKDFKTKVKGIRHSFKLNDHVSVLAIDLDYNNFELVAIDDKMGILWRTTLTGYVLETGVSKGKILVITASEYSAYRNNANGPYTADLIDGQNGKLKLQKVIYQSTADTKEYSSGSFSEDGSLYSLLIRQSGGTRRYLSDEKFNETKGMTVIILDDNLSVTTIKPKLPSGDFLTSKWNNNGDLFVITGPNEKTINIFKYEAGMVDYNEPISQDVDMHDKSDLEKPYCEIAASSENRNLIYLAITKKNHNNEYQLTVGKFDFKTHSGKIVTEVFDKQHRKDISNSFERLDKDFDKPYIMKHTIVEKDIFECNGKLVVILATPYDLTYGDGTPYFFKGAFVINGYDTDLKPTFQQALPAACGSTSPDANHCDKNFLYMVTNTAFGPRLNKFHHYYGKLNLATGEWVKLLKSPKGAIDDNYLASSNVLWFTDGFIIPYIKSHYFDSTDIDLQLNTY